MGLRARVIILLAAALGLVTVTGPTASAKPNDVFTVYMTPREKGGMDANDGLSPGTGVITFVRVEEILRDANPTTDVEVRITRGVF